MKQYHLIVNGKVQGVGFRYFVQTLALEYQVTGWVRNKVDGTVECVAVCSENTFHSFIEKLKKGNRFAKVQHVEITESKDRKSVV